MYIKCTETLIIARIGTYLRRKVWMFYNLSLVPVFNRDVILHRYRFLQWRPVEIFTSEAVYKIQNHLPVFSFKLYFI